MFEICFIILTIYSIAFFIKESSILNKPRNWLLSRSPFFFKMLDCWYCTGTHAGWISYLLIESFKKYSLVNFILFALIGGPICVIINGIVNKLYAQPDEDYSIED